MKKAKVTFHKCLQDSQDLGSDDEHMVSRVFFTLEIDGKIFNDLHVDLKQSVGSDFETGCIEVGHPKGYKGPFNYTVFRDGVEKYYRSLVGSQGRGIRTQGGSRVRMRNNTFIQELTIEFEVGDADASW